MTNEPEPNTRAVEAQAHQLATALMGVERFTADGNFHPDYLAMLTRPLPQPSELVAEVKRLTTLADDHFRNARRLSEVVVARDAQIAKLQADGDKLAGALERSRQGWSNVLELGLLPVQHQSTALGLQEAATQALTEWKDRA
jgi:hypothetical protein